MIWVDEFEYWRDPQGLSVWSYDVAVSTHEDLREGWLVHHWTRVTVAAESESEARLIACQMAACGGWMPTKVMLRL